MTEVEYDSGTATDGHVHCILPGDHLRRLLIQIFPLTFMSHSLVFKSLFNLLNATLTRALGQIPRRVHLALTSSSSLPHLPGGFQFLRARNSSDLAAILGIWHRSGGVWNNSRRRTYAKTSRRRGVCGGLCRGPGQHQATQRELDSSEKVGAGRRG